MTRFGVRVHGAGDYPERLRDAKHPVELLYYQGWWELVKSRCIAVVGTRKPTEDGVARTRRLVKALVKDDFTIVSGLATGVDTTAHETAISNGGRTIAVIGTPLSHIYPRDNAELQRFIAREFLLISQVPVRRWEEQANPRNNRYFFPERNITMSALTEASIIVEAGETSGTLIQARAALEQGASCSFWTAAFAIHPSHGLRDSLIRVPSGSWTTMTSDSTFPLRLTEIDDLTRPDHSYLEPADKCYFIGEYTARKGFAYSPGNRLIINFKKPMDRRGTSQWRWKDHALQQAAKAFRTALNTEFLDVATFVPIPPSKARTDPLYDDRMTRMLQAIRPQAPIDVREFIVQAESTAAAHDRSDRLGPAELEAMYRIDAALKLPPPRVIAICDDMLTTGSHFRAAQRVLHQTFPGVRTLGLFIVRRVPEAVDFPDFEDE